MTNVYRCNQCYADREFIGHHPVPPVCGRPVEVEGKKGDRTASTCLGTLNHTKSISIADRLAGKKIGCSP